MFWVVLGAIPILPLGFDLSGQLPSSAVRMVFTVVQSSFALALWWHNCDPHAERHANLPALGNPEKAALLGFGMPGGLISGLLVVGWRLLFFHCWCCGLGSAKKRQPPR